MYGSKRIRAFRQINGLVEAPVYFADDGYFYQQDHGKVTFDIDKDLTGSGDGLRVYNFHPIHVFLNSENLAGYALGLTVGHDAHELAKIRYGGEGVRSRPMRLISHKN